MTLNNGVLNKIFNIDSRLILEKLPPGIEVQTTITSPPYFDMKDYESDNQVGFGQTYQEYLEDLKKIFESVFKITNDNGTLWIIIDTFKRNNHVVTLPFDLSNKLSECGWLLQDIIIWKKDKTVPWSTNGFMQRKFEYILFFSKSKSYKSNKDNVRIYDTSRLKKWWVKYPERYNPKGKALDEIWEFPIPVQGSWGNQYIRHFCPLPKEMVATMINISTDENDIVLDPFAGTGTVLSQSAYMKRKYLGFELNKSYIKMFDQYLNITFSQNRKEYELLSKADDQEEFEVKILQLRALKYGRILITKVEKELGLSNLKILVTFLEKMNIKNKLLNVTYEIIGDLNKTEVLPIIDKIKTTPPLSKFGITPNIKFQKRKRFENDKLFGYTSTNTYSYQKNISLDSSKIKVVSDIEVDLNENNYL